MKKLILSIAFVLFAFLVNAQDFNHVLVSKELVNNKPAIIYVNYGAEFYLTFRDGKRQFDYKLKNIGGHTMGGYTEVSFSATLPSNDLVKGLVFRLTFADGGGTKPPTLVMLVDEKESGSFTLKGI